MDREGNLKILSAYQLFWLIGLKLKKVDTFGGPKTLATRLSIALILKSWTSEKRKIGLQRNAIDLN